MVGKVIIFGKYTVYTLLNKPSIFRRRFQTDQVNIYSNFFFHALHLILALYLAKAE